MMTKVVINADSPYVYLVNKYSQECLFAFHFLAHWKIN